jgi:uncharacterized membrane protein (UPF0136 family)
MADRSEPRAGGAILALSVLAGAILGVVFGQPTIGVIAGTATGILAAIAIWLRDRARRGG